MTTPILKLPEADQSQANLYPTHNEALRQLEVLLTRVLSMTTTAQPASPADGDAYIIPTGATGTDWASYTAGQIAWYSAGAWSATTAPDGLSVLVKDKNARYTVNAGAWALSITGAVSMADLQDAAQDLGTTTGLTYGYQGFRYRSDVTVTDVPAGTVALTASATNYVECDKSGTVTANTTGFTANRIPLAEVVTDASSIISVTDKRAWLIEPSLEQSMVNANMSAGQAIAAGTWTQIAFDVVDYDDLGEWSTTNHNFTAAHPGYYRVTTSVDGSTGTAGIRQCALQVNGVQKAQDYKTSATGFENNHFAKTLALNAGDTVSVWYNNSVADSINPDASISYVCVERVK